MWLLYSNSWAEINRTTNKKSFTNLFHHRDIQITKYIISHKTSHLPSTISLCLTLSLRHSPMATSCLVITLFIKMLWAFTIVERSAKENTHTPFRQIPAHRPDHLANWYLGTGTRSWVMVQVLFTWDRESSLTRDSVAITCSSAIYVSLAHSEDASKLLLSMDVQNVAHQDMF